MHSSLVPSQTPSQPPHPWGLLLPPSDCRSPCLGSTDVLGISFPIFLGTILTCSCVESSTSKIPIFDFLGLLPCFPGVHPPIASQQGFQGRRFAENLHVFKYVYSTLSLKLLYGRASFGFSVCSLCFSCLEYYLLPFHPPKSLPVFKVKSTCLLLQEAYPTSSVLGDYFFLLSLMLFMTCIIITH